ncbi:hypothetical protein [Evansella halocellulosilytica]|uniref:hypothetical protein n=1 Tax=Evansella halocellulosilytica TaxID=2011013 RepID=UPI000BB6CF41|nr:hypothetical protein [Evansella halocellulosilytica]
MNHLPDIKMLENISNVHEWKNAYEKELRKLSLLSSEISKLEQELYTTGKASDDLHTLKEKKQKILTDTSFKKLVQQHADQMTDPLWKKRLTLMLNEIESQEIEADPDILSLKSQLENKLYSQQYVVGGTSYNIGDVQSVLVSNPNKHLREKLMNAVNEQSAELEEDFRLLLKKRNEKARERGYRHYHEYKFGVEKLNFQQYRTECSKMFDPNNDTYKQWIRMAKELIDHSSLSFTDLLYSATNYGDIDQSIFSHEKVEQAIYHSLSVYGIKRGDTPIDIRVLNIPYQGMCNYIDSENIKVLINKIDSHSSFATGFHETGHALYFHYANPSIFEFKHFQSTISHEAMAELFMTIPFDKEWLTDYLQLDDKHTDSVIEAKHFSELMTSMYFYYLSLVEYELYKNPDGDFLKTANSCFKDVFAIEGTSQHPATQAVFISFPVYVHSYIYASVVFVTCCATTIK